MNEKPLKSFGNWELVERLGVGAFGEVHLWSNHETEQKIVTKRLKHNPKLMADENNKLYKRWIQEEKWMKCLKTPYIVAAVEISDQPFLRYLQNQNPSIGYTLPVITMEYCNSGDVRSQLNNIKHLNGMNEYEVRNIFLALVKAIKYLHENCNIEHRDIKPENIVCHTEGKNKIYKLSDFGYSRIIPESTIAQSVVGTRNYVAPEVIDGGVYSETIDYFSIGIVLYEVTCGIQSFIPDESMFTRIECILGKPSDCIAIIHNVNEQNENDRFKFINYIIPQNQSSTIFVKQMEEWLRLALKSDYKTRGYNEKNELIFYTGADKILATKIVTVFSLKTFKKYYYNIDTYDNLKDFINRICNDSNIDINNIFVIHPPLHPKKIAQKPQDYFVPEWCDTGDTDNPPVMLYVDEFRKVNNCDIPIDTSVYITETIKICMNMNPQFDKIPDWLLQQFVREVHYILNHNQHMIQCYIMGLHKYVLDIEHYVSTYESEICELDKVLELKGCLKHFITLFDELVSNGQLIKPSDMKNQFNAKYQELERKIVALKHNYKVISQNCKDLATNKIYENINDIFELSDYRDFLSLNYTNEERLERSQMAIDKWLIETEQFAKNSEFQQIRKKLNEQIENFISLREYIGRVLDDIKHLESKINDYTRYLLKHLQNDANTTLSMTMSSMLISDSTSNSLIRNNGSIISNVNDIEAVHDFYNTLKNMTQLMDGA